MSARTFENSALPIPHCTVNGTTLINGTCVQRVDHLFQAFSSTLVLIVLLAVILGIIFVSISTFHFHKSKMKKRKMQRAQDEYERDNCSPKMVKGKTAVRQCIMVRSGYRDSGHRNPSAVQKCSGNMSSQNDSCVLPIHDKVSNADSRLTEQANDQLLETVTLS